MVAFVSPLAASRQRPGGGPWGEGGWEGWRESDALVKIEIYSHTIAAKPTTDLSEWLTADFRYLPIKNPLLIDKR